MKKNPKQQKNSASAIEWGDLERFTEVGAKVSKPYLTLTAVPTMQFSAGFIHKFSDLLDNNTHVLLSYSKFHNALVIEFTDDSTEEGAIKMTIRGRKSISLSIRSFLSFNHLNKDQVAGRYFPRLENIPKKGNVLVVFLNEKAQ